MDVPKSRDFPFLHTGVGQTSNSYDNVAVMRTRALRVEMIVFRVNYTYSAPFGLRCLSLTREPNRIDNENSRTDYSSRRKSFIL